MPVTGATPAAVVDPLQVESRLHMLRHRIRRAGGDPAAVVVVAVTKGWGPSAVMAAATAGLADVGENYAQELLAKHAAVSGGPPRWHFIGAVQRNKVKALAPVVGLWQTVDRQAVGRSIAAHAPGAAVLVEVNTTGEPTKAGCAPQATASLVEDLVELGLDVRGLMTVGPAGPPEGARPAFRALAALAARLGLAEVSMGMTGDLDVAVQEGATMVRVGTGLFGPRPPNRDLRR